MCHVRPSASRAAAEGSGLVCKKKGETWDNAQSSFFLHAQEAAKRAVSIRRRRVVEASVCGVWGLCSFIINGGGAPAAKSTTKEILHAMTLTPLSLAPYAVHAGNRTGRRGGHDGQTCHCR